ncbi:type I-F CRISPR-associated protein Cas7f/Csy3 [Sulfurimonas sp.]
MATTKKTEIALGNTLAFKRALEITDGAMFSLSKDGNETKINPYLHGMRTQKSFDTSKDEGDAGKGNGNDTDNLSLVEMAKLNAEDNTLLLKFAVTILPIFIEPEIAESNEQKTLIIEKNKALIANEEAMNFIADCYAYKIINAAWAWRNRDSAIKITTKVKLDNDKEKELTIKDVQKMPLHPVLTSIQKEFGDENPLVEYRDTINTLSQVIKETFQDKREPLQLEISAELQMTNGATIYPSQLFEPESIKIGKSPLGKKLYTVPFNTINVNAINVKEPLKSVRYENPKVQVGITAEKINNALRKFDLVTDKSSGAETIISFDPNGSDSTSKKAFRADDKTNLIMLYKKLLNSNIEDLEQSEKIFLIAMLVRGGLFQEKSTKGK